MERMTESTRSMLEDVLSKWTAEADEHEQTIRNAQAFIDDHPDFDSISHIKSDITRLEDKISALDEARGFLMDIIEPGPTAPDLMYGLPEESVSVEGVIEVSTNESSDLEYDVRLDIHGRLIEAAPEPLRKFCEIRNSGYSTYSDVFRAIRKKDIESGKPTSELNSLTVELICWLYRDAYSPANIGKFVCLSRQTVTSIVIKFVPNHRTYPHFAKTDRNVRAYRMSNPDRPAPGLLNIQDSYTVRNKKVN